MSKGRKKADQLHLFFVVFFCNDLKPLVQDRAPFECMQRWITQSNHVLLFFNEGFMKGLHPAVSLVKHEVFERKGRNTQLAIPVRQTGGQMGSKRFFGGVE